MESKLENLSVNSKQKQVADSWEEESSDTENEILPADEDAHHTRNSPTGAKFPIPNAPPPTPISPRSGYDDFPPQAPGRNPNASLLLASTYSSSSRRDEKDKRPEKTTAAAGRMIAGALGVRAPKKTEEERKYDRAIKEQEIKRKNREKEAKMREVEDDEKAKRDVWDG